MSDRLVRQIDPKPNDEVVETKRFSDYAETPNIVLVGDPGAGKSHLLTELAQVAKTSTQSARAFLNTPPGAAGATVFIDALDERRAGRSDQTTIDLIVQKLFEVRASRVRLACREHDWLGGTDLAAFHPYFAQSGGHVVLALEPLTQSEQYDVLRKTGVFDPQQFIRDADGRGLSEFLINPQNLIMLAEVVLNKTWPKTRRQLFEDTTALLLKEHNLAHVRGGGGKYTVNEVRPPASAACALRLISGVEGISLTEAEIDPLYPSYRTIPFAQPELTLASLGRRAFRSIGIEAVDYSHRVSAEYAAAGWLAQSIRNGLPLSRVQALIGIDGVPAPELRGLHAWLATLLPEFSDFIIDADPLGILIYSDPNSLSLKQRVQLLRALTSLAAADPYFRAEDHPPTATSALCQADMVPHLKGILQNTSAPFGIKALILEALVSSPPLPSLGKEVLAIIANRTIPFGLKAPAIRSAARFGPAITKAMTKIYDGLDESTDDIRLRAYILSTIYVGNFSAKNVSDLYNATARCKDDLISGILWQVSASIPTHDIPSILNAVRLGQGSDRKHVRHNRSERERFVERLIIRALEEGANDVSGQSLWNWLELRRSIRNEYEEVEFNAVKPILAERPELTRAVFDAAIEGYIPTPNWQFSNRLRINLPFSLSDEPVRWLISRLLAGVQNAGKRQTLYELAWSWIYGNPEENASVFESLYFLADASPDLLPIRDPVLACEIKSWPAGAKQRADAASEKRRAGRLKNLQQFAKDIDLVRQGTHLGWLIWAADVYFANFSDVDRSKSPRERLEDELGAENTAAVLDGLKAFVRVGRRPSLADLSAADSKNSYPRIWSAFLAGMDELWLETPSLANIQDDLLKILAGIELLIPTSTRHEPDAYSWKSHLISTKATLVKDVYLYLAEAALKESRPYVSALYALLNDVSLEVFRGEITYYLLSKYSHLPSLQIEDVFQVALAHSPRDLILDLARRKLDPKAAPSDEQRQVWTLAAYLLSPESYRAALETQAKRTPSIVWRMRALTSHDGHNRTAPVFSITTAQRELFAHIAASHFPNIGHPSGGWSGDENPWDAAEYVRSLLNGLSADASREATEALQRLATDPVMTTYVDSIQHALANQRTRHREMMYKQPNLAEAIATLSGGSPANVADLQALVVEHLREISRRIGTQNNDIYKSFWSEDSYGRPTDPKVEESARDVLLGQFRVRLEPLGVIVEPEGHMVADKRADITAALPGRKLILELKRDIRNELWRAPATQLDRFYTRDPDASGYGVFGVFWYGTHRKGKLPKHPKRRPLPKSAAELEAMLSDIIVGEQRTKLQVIVIDVSIPVGQRAGIAKPGRKTTKSKPKASQRKHATSKSLVKPSKPKTRKSHTKKAPPKANNARKTQQRRR